MSASSLLVLLPLLSASGCHSKPRIVEVTIVFPPLNTGPALDSLVAIPDSIGPSDSTIVYCFAHDIDGDTLVYDWSTDARLNIEGVPPSRTQLSNTYPPYHTFYNANLANPINDSAWVQCVVRDGRGGGSARTVFIVLRPPVVPKSER